jgi:hypothetical protein
MLKHNYTEDQFREAVSTSLSVRQALCKLNIIPAGGNYRTFHNFVKRYRIDTSHFTGMLWSKGKKLGYVRPLSDYTVLGIPIQSDKLRRRLISDGVKTHCCENCQHAEWCGNPIPLELDHINGQHSDNSLENLRLLCPNCHALTSTYRGKNKGSSKS